jgi:RNA polymerase sigma-70 factor (ECF subfamily)
MSQTLAAGRLQALPAAPEWRMTDSDQDLVSRTKSGDAEAFSELVRRHQHRVYALALRFMRDPTKADDMAQEAFLKAYRLIDGFRGDSSLSTWLYRVTCSVCLNELQRNKRRGEVALAPVHENLQSVDAESGEKDELHDLVRRCVDQLPERYATVLTLYYLQECSYEEIAGVLDVRMNTLKTWMRRARERLRDIVDKELARHGLSE